MKPCPCQSGLPYDECCGPFHRGESPAPTAERLMRSRYSAYAFGEVAYLLGTWHPSTRPAALELDGDIRWYRLDILGRTGGGILDNKGTVTFEARYRSPAGPRSQYEKSNFVRENGAWYYVDAAS